MCKKYGRRRMRLSGRMRDVQMKLNVLAREFSVCKVSVFPAEISGVWFAAQTDEEKSLVCESEFTPADVLDVSGGWRAMRIEGVLDFSLIGILAKISAVLARAEVGIFAVSTFNTDYILVKKADLDRAVSALRDAGYAIE